MNIIKWLFAVVLLNYAWVVQAAPPLHSEEQMYHFRQEIQEVGKAMQQGDDVATFTKVQPLAQQGFAEAEYILGTLYHDGVGTAQDWDKARHWYQKAAKQTENEHIAALAKEALMELQSF